MQQSERLPIRVADSGFYNGFNRFVTLGAKLSLALFIVWVAIAPKKAGEILGLIQTGTVNLFSGWYMYVTFFFVLVCLGLAAWPKSGRQRLGRLDERPEFSNFSWFSMMFGAGIGVGMLTYSTAEPIFHFANNPDVIKGAVEAQSAENVRMAYKWAAFHYALTPWACYGIVGMALGYFSYNQNLPLTIRSGLMPLFGKSLSGPLGHIVDIVAIIATISGVGVTIGYGVSQFASGIYNITGLSWISAADGKPTLAAQLIALVIIMLASTLSAMSGVKKGIKWLSNINMGLSFFLLLFFVLFGATLFAFKSFFLAIWDYLIAFPKMSLSVWSSSGDETEKALSAWQASWSIFYWAWWIGFAPFVGLFLARVSRGRTIREYVLGAMLVPTLMCLTWFALVGGTAIDLELSGIAKGAILNADISAQLYETINLLLSPVLAILMSFVIVVLLMTYLITSADSAILIINTISSAGDAEQKHSKHIILWGLILMSVIAVLLIAGGMGALRSVMIIGALPFSLVMALMAMALLKSLLFDSKTKP
jgi:choline/carnitine/betaine transport